MSKTLLSIAITLTTLCSITSQDCQITSITATPLACNGFNYSVSIDLEVDNPASPGFTLAGNGVLYGTFLYEDLPVVVGPLLGDNTSSYEFIAWDVDNPACQNYTTMPAADCGPICSFSNPVLEFLSCQSLLSALVTLDFDYENVSNPAFDLFYENGSQAGSWLYESLPVTIQFFVVSGAAPIHLTVCDKVNPNCCETFSFEPIDCNPNNCELVNMMVDPECTGNNFLVHLDFTYSNPPSDSFTLQGNNLNYGTFAYSELPVTIGPLNGSSSINWEFVVTDKVNANCNNVAVLGQYHCPPPCQMESLIPDVVACNSDSTYAVSLGIELEGDGDLGFAVFSESKYYGNHSYDDLPLLLEGIAGTGEFIDQITVCDVETPTCCATMQYEAFLCQGCVIADIVATPQPCDNEDMIWVEIDFYHYNVSDLGFEVSGNGTNYGSFLYEQLPILVGPFPGDGSTFLEFAINDLEDPFCFAAIEVGELTCEEICELSNLTVTTGDCTGDDTYVAHIDFDYQGVTGIGFDLFVNGVLYDFYDYDDLPLTIEEFPSSGTGTDVITVCENDNNMCCATIEYAAPDCACSVFDANVEILGCTSDSTYAVSLEFFMENAPNQAVDIYFDGVYQGLYNAANIPITLDNVPEGNGAVLITVCAVNQNDCCDEVLVEQIECESPECNIWDLIAEHGDCNSDSTYLLDIAFNHINLPGDSITVTANGELIGTYLIHPDFNRIEHFPVLASNNVHLVICATDDPACCEDVNFEAPDCSNFGQCHIFDLTANVGDCQSDSTYILHVEFEYNHLPTDSVIITANGNVLGTYQVHEGSITLEHVAEYETNHTVVTVCAAGDPECCDVIEFETPHCGQNFPCEIDDLVAIIGDCQSDSTYILHIEFNFDNLPTDSVSITANGNALGHYQVHEGSIFLEHFVQYETNHTVVTVCAVGNNDCCDVVEFETPNCGAATECHIFDLIADPGDCTSDSTYNLFLQYESQNLPGDSVIVTANEFIWIVPHNEDGITIGSFPIFNTPHTTVHVCAFGSPDCCDVVEFETPDCGQGAICHFHDLFAEVGQCTSDSTYVVDIVFHAFNTPGDSVIVYANDIEVGQYEIPSTFIHIENFPRLPGEHTTVTICAVGDPECCDQYVIEVPFCSEECTIQNIDLQSVNCNSDSTFTAVFNFDYYNISAGGFDYYAGDVYLGFHNIENVPVELHNFPSNETGQYIVTICESDNTECCASFEFNGPVCDGEPCHIYDLTYVMTECDSNGHFYFILDFAFDNVGPEGFDVVGNGNNYGTFSYDDLPIQLGPFENTNLIWEFGVRDHIYHDCAEDVTPGDVDCTVSTLPVQPVDFFQVVNNGTRPRILAKQDIQLTIYHSNGQVIVSQKTLTSNQYFELNEVSDGMYIGLITAGQHVWPVKMIRSNQ